MQALCPTCNSQKGDKTVQRLPVFDFNKSKFRQGQSDAFDETILRIQHKGESHTAIVLPTRYGKSDYMRMTGLHLLHEGAVSGILVMTPNRVLRNQMVDSLKMKLSFRWYEAKMERITRRGERRRGIAPYNIDTSPKIGMMVDSEIVAATTSMVSNNLPTFRHWIDHLRKSHRDVPPVVFVDEAHTASNQTAWGQTIADLAAAGAYIVLCTATPYRTDGQPIPGFEVETIAMEDLQDRQRRGAYIYPRQGQKVVYRLVAHHVTTFEQAWQESVLCQVSREPYDVDLREHGMDGYEHHMLSGLESELSSRRALHQAVRDPAVIREGVRRLVRNLRYRRKDAPETAGIVFVGSDDGSYLDDEQDEVGGQMANQYAKMVQKILREEGPELTSVIATSKVDGDPTKTIEDFSKGRGGDVLVVKMMASVGLDVARLKVALDLSTVRTAVSFVQRVMRICTRWERDEGEPVLRATYITPDEFRGRELYNDLIHDLGGSTSEIIRWDEETGEIIQKPYTPRPPNPLTTWEVTGTEEGEYLTDSDGTIAPGSTLPYVDAIYEEESALTRVIGKAKLGRVILETAERYAKDNFANAATTAQSDNGPVAPLQTETYEPTDKELIDDVQGRMDAFRKSIGAEVRARAARQLRQEHNGTFPKELLGPTIQDTWVWLYRTAGIPWYPNVRQGQRLQALDEDQLRLMWGILKEEA